MRRVVRKKTQTSGNARVVVSRSSEQSIPRELPKGIDEADDDAVRKENESLSCLAEFGIIVVAGDVDVMSNGDEEREQVKQLKNALECEPTDTSTSVSTCISLYMHCGGKFPHCGLDRVYAATPFQRGQGLQCHSYYREILKRKPNTEEIVQTSDEEDDDDMHRIMSMLKDEKELGYDDFDMLRELSEAELMDKLDMKEGHAKKVRRSLVQGHTHAFIGESKGLSNESKFAKYTTMRKNKLPDGAIRQKMTMNSMPQADIDAFFAATDKAPASAVTSSPQIETGDESKFAKYTTMRKNKLPDGAIRQKMTMNSMPQADIDAFFAATDKAPASAVTSSPQIETGDESKFAKYTTMRKNKLPDGAIRQKMTMNSMPQADIDAFFAATDKAPASAVTSSPQIETGDESKFAKYTTMRKNKLPDGAIRQKMTMNSMPQAEIDAFFGTKASGFTEETETPILVQKSTVDLSNLGKFKQNVKMHAEIRTGVQLRKTRQDSLEGVVSAVINKTETKADGGGMLSQIKAGVKLRPSIVGGAVGNGAVRCREPTLADKLKARRETLDQQQENVPEDSKAAEDRAKAAHQRMKAKGLGVQMLPTPAKQEQRVYTYEMLKSGDVGADVDIFKKESYLSDASFAKVMGVAKDTFYKLPKWKRDKKKKEVGLF